jgi:hypothetical protein
MSGKSLGAPRPTLSHLLIRHTLHRGERIRTTFAHDLVVKISRRAISNFRLLASRSSRGPAQRRGLGSNPLAETRTIFFHRCSFFFARKPCRPRRRWHDRAEPRPCDCAGARAEAPSQGRGEHLAQNRTSTSTKGQWHTVPSLAHSHTSDDGLGSMKVQSLLEQRARRRSHGCCIIRSRLRQHRDESPVAVEAW